MKSMKNLALVIGLLALSGVSQAQFSSTWTAVSDYDFRGYSQSATDPALQGSADYAFGETGLSIGAWASNVKFDGYDGNIELDTYLNYVGKINDTFSWTAGLTRYNYPDSSASSTEFAIGEYFEGYVGFNAGNFSAKQWYSNDFYNSSDNAEYTEVNYTQPFGDKFSLAFHAGYAWGDYWDDFGGGDITDYAVQGNFTAGNFTLFAKFTGTDASGAQKVKTDSSNNEPRILVGVMTTFPWK
jgi:uncharacterized protein (TIGR02001 family)